VYESISIVVIVLRGDDAPLKLARLLDGFLHHVNVSPESHHPSMRDPK
jgi:hypothetical protein